MIKCFELNPEQIKIRDILTNKNFLEMEIYAISSADPNRNRSCFTLESMREGLSTFVDKPILGFFNKGDFEAHNGKADYDPELGAAYWNNAGGEQILGFIRQSDQREIVEKDGLYWIRCTAMVYTQYNYKQIKRLLKDKHKKVSVEVTILDSELKNGIEYIKKFELTGITILGSKNGVPVREGIEGAHLSVLDLMDNLHYNNQRAALTFAYRELDGEQGEEVAVNKSFESMSAVELTAEGCNLLLNRVVSAANFQAIAPEVYLDLQEGWEKGNLDAFKCPVMMMNEDNELVYNRANLEAAKQYALAFDKDDVLEKVKDIYAELGMKFDDDEDDIDDDDDEGNCDGDEGEDGDKNKQKESSQMDNDAKLSVPSVESCDEPEKELTMEDYKLKCEELEAKCAELEKECGSCKGQCSELECKCAAYEKELEDCKALSEEKCAEFAAKCEEYEANIASLNTAHAEELSKFADYEDVKKSFEEAKAELEKVHQKEREDFLGSLMQRMNLSEDDVKDIKEKCSEGKFASTEEIENAVALVVYRKEYAKVQSAQAENTRYAVTLNEPAVESNTRKNLTVSERLKQNLNK